ncbi:hypothetical protein GINT2_002092 [Glugoides intestinalis]
MAQYQPEISILVHEDCVYSKALKVLLDWGNTAYKEMNVKDNLDLLKKNSKIPQVYIDGKNIGGYRDSLKSWQYVYRMLPLEPNFEKLYDPEYVVKKYKRNGKTL